MNPTFWVKQTIEQPLFPELLWSRPEHRKAAGRLLIIGGNVHGFAAPAEAYSESVKAGIGTARVLMPDAIQKLIGPFMKQGEFAPSTPSGSFSQKALAEFLEHSDWADATLFAGDLGRNSETAIAIETFLQKTSKPLVLTKDAVDYASNLPEIVLNRPDTLLVMTMAHLQKLGIAAKLPTAITFGMDLIRLVEALHFITEHHPIIIIVKHLSNILCAKDGNVSTTALKDDVGAWRLKTATHAAVWWLQNPGKSFEAMTTALIAEPWGKTPRT